MSRAGSRACAPHRTRGARPGRGSGCRRTSDCSPNPICSRADEALTRALTVATAHESRWLALRAATSLARLRVRQKRNAEAARLLAPFAAAIARDPGLRDAVAARTVVDEIPRDTA